MKHKLDSTGERIVFLDYLRVAACFMVILIHCIEPFYIGSTGISIASESDARWVTGISSALRACVPLFMLTSSYLLFPIKTDTKMFFKKRMVRIGIPFLVWSLLYIIVGAFTSGDYSAITADLKTLPFNFVMTSSGHLWFVYMLLGIYLIMPLLSPWAEKVSKKEEKAFLMLWGITTLLPLIRPAAEIITGSSDLWGECYWNGYGTFYYVSGFIGILVLGHYFRTHVGEMSWQKTLSYALPLWMVGYAITAGGYWLGIDLEQGFPWTASYATLPDLETTWNPTSLGVVMQTVAYFLLFRKIAASGFLYTHIIMPISKLSYGIYLMHMMFLTPAFTWVSSFSLPTPLVMIGSAALTFIASILTTRLLAYLPKSKYIIG